MKEEMGILFIENREEALFIFDTFKSQGATPILLIKVATETETETETYEVLKRG